MPVNTYAQALRRQQMQMQMQASVVVLIDTRMRRFRSYNSEKDVFTFVKLPNNLHETITKEIYAPALEYLQKINMHDFFYKKKTERDMILERVLQMVRENIGECRRRYARSMKLKFDGDDALLAPYLADFFLTDPKREYSFAFMFDELARIAGQGIWLNPFQNNLVQKVVNRYLALFLLHMAKGNENLRWIHKYYSEIENSFENYIGFAFVYHQLQNKKTIEEEYTVVNTKISDRKQFRRVVKELIEDAEVGNWVNETKKPWAGLEPPGFGFGFTAGSALPSSNEDTELGNLEKQLRKQRLLLLKNLASASPHQTELELLQDMLNKRYTYHQMQQLAEQAEDNLKVLLDNGEQNENILRKATDMNIFAKTREIDAKSKLSRAENSLKSPWSFASDMSAARTNQHQRTPLSENASDMSAARTNQYQTPSHVKNLAEEFDSLKKSSFLMGDRNLGKKVN